MENQIKFFLVADLGEEKLEISISKELIENCEKKGYQILKPLFDKLKRDSDEKINMMVVNTPTQKKEPALHQETDSPEEKSVDKEPTPKKVKEEPKPETVSKKDSPEEESVDKEPTPKKTTRRKTNKK